MAVGGSQNDCTRNDPPPRGGVGDGLRRVTIMGRLDGAGASSRAELARVGAALGLLLGTYIHATSCGLRMTPPRDTHQ